MAIPEWVSGAPIMTTEAPLILAKVSKGQRPYNEALIPLKTLNGVPIFDGVEALAL